MTRGALFLVGPLAEPGVFEAMTGRAAEGEPARLPDHRLVAVTDDAPVAVPRPGSVIEGRLVAMPEGAARARLDVYAATLDLVLREVEVARETQRVAAMLLDGAPPCGEAPDWNAGAWRARTGARWPLVAAEIAGHAPPMSPGSFARQRTMIEARAAARLRAALDAAPAALRHAPQPEDFDWRADAPLVGEFFKLARMRMDHRRFDGGRAEALPREVLVGVDAALVLPYDPRSDRVLLVEQFRTGPARRGARNPWTLEPVAGIVDPGESPEAAGLREAREEAGLVLDRLTPIFKGYPSPGSNTDYFHCFLALAELPREESWRGGLAEEHEDLRLHAISFDRAMDLVQTGEIDALPLQAMLYWLARHRVELRAAACPSGA